jgi:hypothetical protein
LDEQRRQDERRQSHHSASSSSSSSSTCPGPVQPQGSSSGSAGRRRSYASQPAYAYAEQQQEWSTHRSSIQGYTPLPEHLLERAHAAAAKLKAQAAARLEQVQQLEGDGRSDERYMRCVARSRAGGGGGRRASEPLRLTRVPQV